MSFRDEDVCGHTAAVIACHLDGEAAGCVEGGELDDHLRDCVRCQEALRRARRLDALVARASGQEVALQLGDAGGEALAQRWFAAVASSVSTAATQSAPASGRRAPFLALAAAAIAAIALFVWWPPSERRARTPSGVIVGDSPAAVASEAVTERVVELAALQHWHRPKNTARSRNDTVLGERHTEVRPNAALVADLHRRATGGALDVGDRGALRAAALRGSSEIDAALRRVARRHPEGVAIVADTLRLGSRASGSGRLLLDLWEDSVVRGRLGEDETVATMLFRGQPATAFVEVAMELRSSSQAAHRRRCLLALGCAGDGGPVPELCAHLQSARHEEALVAAFALSCLPGSVLAALVAEAAAPEATLLRAALLRSDAPELRQWRTQVPVPIELRARLLGASLAQFLEIAPWLRHNADVAE